MNLSELRRAFREGLLSKPDYIDAMNERHRLLHDYADLLGETDIARIEIADGQVVMTTRDAGLRFVCARGDKRIAPIETLNFGRYERDYAEMLLSLVPAGGKVLDIGANVGWYSMTVARRVPGVSVLAFEPMPPVMEALRRNLDLNGISSVRPLPVALSEKEGTATFYFDPENSVNASAADLGGGPATRSVECPVRLLDDVCRELVFVPDMIKCDVEGAELLVLRGALETLKKARPVVALEMLRKWSARFGYHPNDIIALMRERGYGCYTVEGARLRPFPAMTDAATEINFFFLHDEAHREALARLVLPPSSPA